MTSEKSVLYFEVTDMEDLLRRNAPNIERGSVSSCHCKCEIKGDIDSLPLHLRELTIAATKDALEIQIGVPKSKIRLITEEEFKKAQEDTDQIIIQASEQDEEGQLP